MFDSQFVLTVSPKPLPALDVLQRGRVDFATTQRAKLVLLSCRKSVTNTTRLLTRPAAASRPSDRACAATASPTRN
jgi:hypothetical protein